METTMTTTTQDGEWMSAQEAAEVLDRHIVTIWRMCRSQRLDAHQVGGSGPWYIRKASIPLLSKAHHRPPPKPDPAPSESDTSTR
jgi:hypothetical protein